MKEDFLTSWRDINDITLELLKSCKDKFYEKPFSPRFKSFSWEFSCLLTTRLGYVRGIKSGKLDGSCFIEDDNEISKMSFEEFIDKLMDSWKVIDNLIRDASGKINYFGADTDILCVISWLLQHEQFHYGKLLLYFAKAEIELPRSFKAMWGEHNF